MIFKKKQNKPAADNNESPYLSARRTWDEHVGSVVTAKQSWQLIAIISSLITLVAVAGSLHLATRSQFVPYVVEIDRIGQAVGVQAADIAQPADPRVIRATLGAFVRDVRMVSSDPEIQRQAILRAYNFIAAGRPAEIKIGEWYSPAGANNPFARAATETASISITSIIQQSSESWLVQWSEVLRNLNGEALYAPLQMQGLIAVEINPHDGSSTEAQMRQNPLGIYVKDIEWVRLD